jgi:Rrf2 family protein
MAESCRFAFAIHILSVLALREKEGVTSRTLAGSVNTNPVVIRRIVSSLQNAGLVKTSKGAGGGVTLAAPAAAIALDSVYRAIAETPSFGQHRTKPNVRCPVGANIQRVLDEVFGSAQEALEAALAERTLADVVSEMVPAPATAPRRRPGAKTRPR